MWPIGSGSLLMLLFGSKNEKNARPDLLWGRSIGDDKHFCVRSHRMCMTPTRHIDTHRLSLTCHSDSLRRSTHNKL